MSVLALLVLAQVALAEPVRVVDGDTFDAGGVRYRLADVDAPERNGRCAAEAALARLATQELERLLARGELTLQLVSVQPATGRYRERQVVRVTAGGQDVGAALLAAGVARPYRARQPGWCSAN